jgi:hypothetical protein
MANRAIGQLDNRPHMTPKPLCRWPLVHLTICPSEQQAIEVKTGRSNLDALTRERRSHLWGVFGGCPRPKNQPDNSLHQYSKLAEGRLIGVAEAVEVGS